MGKHAQIKTESSKSGNSVLQERDVRILEAIYVFDGMMGAQQIKRMFFDTWRTARGRLSKLYKAGYLNRCDRMRRAALPDMVYFLGRRGAEFLADLNHEQYSEFRWRREPKWSMVAHDLRVNDFRLDVSEACAMNSALELEEWIPGNEFWARPDVIVYEDGNGKREKRGIRPDGYFVIQSWRAAEDKWYRSRLLLEIDMRTEDIPRFGREKVRPGIAYLRSDAYERRFGFKSGRWLVVTTGERRMQNMKRQTETAAGKDANLFYFTWFDLISPQTLLTEPIWYRGGGDDPTALFQPT